VIGLIWAHFWVFAFEARWVSYILVSSAFAAPSISFSSSCRGAADRVFAFFHFHCFFFLLRWCFFSRCSPPMSLCIEYFPSASSSSFSSRGFFFAIAQLIACWQFAASCRLLLHAASPRHEFSVLYFQRFSPDSSGAGPRHAAEASAFLSFIGISQVFTQQCASASRPSLLI